MTARVKDGERTMGGVKLKDQKKMRDFISQCCLLDFAFLFSFPFLPFTDNVLVLNGVNVLKHFSIYVLM